MRYQPAHAATGDREPAGSGTPSRSRRALAIAVAAAVGLGPAVLIAAPAHAAPGDVFFDSDLEGPEADTFAFELRRQGGSNEPLTLAYSTGGGTATPNVDYTPISGITTFQASSNSVVKKFIITGLTDNLDEDDETFTLTFTGTTAGGQPVSVAANGILDDDDATPTYNLTVTNPVAEAAGNAVVTATLSAISGRDVTIPVSTADGSATAGQDYSSLTNANISIPAGNPSGTVNVPIIDDALDETDQQGFTVAGANNTGTNVAGGGSVAVQIADDEATPTVSVGSPGAAVETSTLSFPLTLSGASERTVTVVTNTANGTATAGADYTAVSGNTVTFVPGDTSETVDVTTASDTLNEVDPETFTLTMSDPVNAVLDADPSATGSINDDDVAPTVNLAPGSVAEGDSGPQVRTFTATLDAPSGRTVAIDYDVSGGTATPGVDYTATSGTLTFAPGDTVKTFDVTVLGDQIDEDPAEDLNVILSNPAGTVANAGSLGTSVITITDDDATPTFSVADVTVAEGGTTAARAFVVTLSNPSAQAVTFDVLAGDGSAVDNGTDPGDNDYDPPSSSVTVAPGDTTAAIALNVVGDTVFEGDETATVTVTRTAGENDASGGPDVSTLTLTNDDTAPSVQLSSEPGVEGSSIALMGTVTGVAQDDIPVDITLAGSSVNGSNPADGPDFTYGGPIAATIPAGDNTGAPVALATLALDDDRIDETDETLLATLTDPAGDVATATGLQTITDNPDDLPPAVSVGDATVNENAGSVDVDVTLAFDAGQDATSTERPVVVSYQTDDGTAVAGADYTTVTNQLTIAAGDTSGTLSVPIIDDNAYEIAETFAVTATSVDPAEAVIADASGTVTIAGNDLGSRPFFSIDNVTRAENAAGTADFTVILSAASSQDVRFDVTTSDDSAEDAGSGPGSNDFDAPPTILTIPAGATTGVVSVPVNADTVFEADETATVEVDLAAGENDAVGSAVAGTLTLTNDDAAPSIALNTDSAAEGGTLDVQATVTGVAQDDITFNLTLTGDSTGSNNAAETGDFTDSGAQATIPAGTATGSTITLRTVAAGNDTVDEATESVRVLVTDDAGIVAAVSSVYTITDDPNDLPPAVALADATVTEGAGPASVPVTLSFGGGNGATSTERPVVVNYQTANGTAIAGSDYTAAAPGASLTIAAGDTSGTIPVVIIDDSAYERAETFTVTATSVTPGEAAIGNATSTVTIGLSDSAARPEFSVANVSRAENAGGPAEITVSLTSPTTQDVDFTVDAADGTAAEAGSGPGSNDYDAPNSTLTIPAGATTGTVAVTVNGDTVFEGNETVTVTVALADGEDDATGSAASATLTLTNDDAAPTLALNSESSTEGTDIVVIGTVTGVAQAATTLTLQLTGDATGGNNPAETADFTDSGAQALIPAGTASGTPLTLRSFRLNNDTVDEPTESVRVRVTDAAGNVAMTSSIYRITDDPNDLPPAISVDNVTVDEGVGNAEVPLTLTYGGANDATSTERNLVVDYLTIAGTAAETADFTAAGSGQVTITAGHSSGTIEVPIVDDARDEFAETFTVRATAVSPADATIAGDSGTVTITDNDPDVPKPTFSVADVARPENATGPATFTVQLSAAAQDPVSFTVAMADDTAVDAGTGVGSNDYNAPAGTLTIPAGETTGTVAVTVNTDSVYETDEAATLTVGLAPGELDAVGSAREATLTIENDDVKPELTLNTASGYEGDDVDVSAVVTGTAEVDVTYELSFFGDNSGNNDGAEETDFDTGGVVAVIPGRTPTGTRLDFGAIRLATDTMDEATETIRMVAHDPDSDTTTTDETSTYRIFDDPDDLPPSIAISDESISEGLGSVDLTVWMAFAGDTTGTEQPIRVPWSTANGTASAGIDFTAAGGTLTIEPGAEWGTINVPILDGEVSEPEQSFTVALGSATPSGVAVTDSVGEVFILDDDEVVAPTLIAPESRVGPGVVGLTGRAAEGATVRLYGAPVAAGSARELLATTTASVTGGYFFSRSLPVGYTFHTRADNLNSPVRTVRLVQSPTLAGSSPSRGVVSLTATGNPKTAGQAVSIQRQNPNGTWSPVASGRLSSAGTYPVTLRGLSSGMFVNYRAVIAATPGQGILGGTSPTRRVGIR
ncbi:MAG TPA: Calx-beta domain-containing protein [Actinoplanes sp.]|nr:Calx-beta domain-containing protein [Actinoplanes sp.]